MDSLVGGCFNRPKAISGLATRCWRVRRRVADAVSIARRRLVVLRLAYLGLSVEDAQVWFQSPEGD